MRTFIIRDRPLRLLYSARGNDRAPMDYSVASTQHNGPFKANFSLGNLKLEPVLDTAQQNVNCSKLEALINSYAAAHGFGEGTSNKRRSDGTLKSSKWDATVSIQRHKEFEPAIISLSGKIFLVLYNLAFPNEVSVKLTMTEYSLCVANQYVMNGNTITIPGGSQYRYPSFSTNEMMIKLVKSSSGEMIGLCRDQSNIIMSEPEFHFTGQGWMEMSVYIKGKFTIEVTLHNFLERCSGPVLNCQKVLMETVGSDLVIKTGDDKEIPCHRSFLAANSPVLKAMLESDMMEARSGRIEMSDISEEGAKAFLAYVYYRDLDKPKEVASVAFELFHVAEKYDMASLKADMKTIFLGMSSSWWKIEVALQMYFLVEKLCDGAVLKRKVLEVLKGKFTDVMNSDCYKNLFKEDPKAAMTFCNDLINFRL